MAQALAPPTRQAVVRLPDGRLLAYAEYGDPGGMPVVYCHGTPGSRYEHPPDREALHDIRLVVPDRPGYGRSGHRAGRRLLDWPQDVEQLADSLGLARFAVVGVSGGGPHAAACAHVIPERLTGVALVSSMAPTRRPGGLNGVGPIMRLAFHLGRLAPWSLRPLIGRLSNPGRDPGRFLLGNTQRLCPSDRRLLARPAIRQMLAADFRESARQGVGGYAQDVIVFSRPWGFRLEEIGIPVHLWHGACDTILPLAMGQYLAQAISDVRARFVPDGGHFLVLEHIGEIVSGLRP